MSSLHETILATPESRALIEDETAPVPDADALRRVGSSERLDFLQVGAIIFHNVKDCCGLSPACAVLDVGCGWGRFAIPLARYLSGEGRYLGVDVAPRAIEWCRENITARHSNFAFRHVDVANTYANEKGSIPAAAARLVEGSDSFDVVVATSLFTHMLPDGMENYFRQIAELCRPGGKFYATFFLLDEETDRLCAEGLSRHTFLTAAGAARISNPAVPEDAVAYPEEYVVERLRAAGFESEVRKGFWSGRPEGGFDYQDVVVATRTTP